MRIAKSAVAILAAACVAATPVIAQAAPERAGSNLSQREQLTGENTVLFLALVAAAATILVLVATDDSGAPNQPTSP